MLLRDLKEIWISKYEEINNHGESEKIWKYKKLDTRTGTAFLNLQQDINELDRKSSGEVDYSIYKARTQQLYNIQKGDGISLSDISKLTYFVPEFRVIDINQIGNTYVYRLEQYNGD